MVSEGSSRVGPQNLGENSESEVSKLRKELEEKKETVEMLLKTLKGKDHHPGGYAPAPGSPVSSTLTHRTCSFSHAPSELNHFNAASSSGAGKSRIKTKRENFGGFGGGQSVCEEWEDIPIPGGHSTSQHHKARVNVVGGARPGGGGVNPIMMETLRRTTPKRLGGRREEFQEWQGLWEEYLQVARAFSPGGLCDFR